MTIEQVRQLYAATPFHPFVIHVADGREIPVLSREFILIAPKGRLLVVAEPNGKLHHIDLLLVTDLVSKLNGASGRSKRRG
jgi:hypothetical protein